MQVKPIVKAFLIADKVMREEGTKKWSVIGIFDRISSKNFPCIHPSLALYIRLSNAEGEYNVKIEFCEIDGKVLSLFEGKLKVGSRLATPEIGIQTYNLPLPKPGRYLFKLYLNDEFIQDFPIDVVQIK